MDANTQLFESMPVRKALTKLAIPTIISQLITMVYNLADTFFVGQTNDPYKVAAVSLASVLFFMLNAWANLFGIGGGSLISQLLGKKQEDKAKNICAFSLYGTVVVAGLYSVACFVFMKPLLTFIGATENTIKYASDYTFYVIVLGGVPSTLSMVMSYMLRSEGHAKQAGFGLSMGGLLNTVLDPLFMFVIMPEGMEVIGAAVATMLSNIIAMLYYAGVFIKLRGRSILSISPKHCLEGMKEAKAVFAIGFPSALSNILVCVAIMVTNNLFARHSDIAVAANGIVRKAEMLPLNVGTGICQGLIPLVSYNYSSGDHKRMFAAIKCARAAGLIFTGACVVLFVIFAGSIARVFIPDPETIELTASFLRIFCLATPLMFCNFQMCYTLQAMGKGRESLLLSACRQGLVNIPLLLIMNTLFGMYGVIWTQLLADTITLIISAVIYRRIIRSL